MVKKKKSFWQILLLCDKKKGPATRTNSKNEPLAPKHEEKLFEVAILRH
jgi:hypothetical protein